MQSVMGIINLNENERRLQELTRNRPLAAIPFAGRYRIIDFILSSMVNSGIENIGILVQDKYRSLMDHLRSGKEWDLARKRDGLFILPPAPDMYGRGNLKGDIANFYNNLDYIRSSRQDHVLITGSGTVCNMNYRKAFQFHENVKADITVIYKELDLPEDDLDLATFVQVDYDGRIADMATRPIKTAGCKVSLGMYIMSKQLLIDIVSNCYARGGESFLVDGLIKNLRAYKVYGYPYKGYLARVYSIAGYYRHHLQLLDADRWEELFFKSGLVYTKVKDEAPAKYKESAKVVNAMIANGCEIEGKVENSILFRGVKVGKGAVVKNSVIMQKCHIGESAIVENVICDKDAHITPGKWLKGEESYPLVVEKGAVI